MSLSALSRRTGVAVILATFAILASAQAQKPPAGSDAGFVPQSGQPGKDVVWVPTPQAVVDRMLDLARAGPADFVMDLGSGDGRTVITAAKRGARALGVEYNPDMVELSKRNAEREGVSDRAAFIKADLFETDFSRASVITMFLLPEINLKLRPKILDLAPGTRVVSNTFTMGDWEPDERADLGGSAGCNSSWCTALFWIVPRRVAGTYAVEQGEVTLTQKYQMLSGTLRAGGVTHKIEGRVRGEDIEFSAGGRQYRGRLNGASLELRAAG